MTRLPVVKGTLDLLVLRALSWTPMHGFEIVSWLERAGGGSLELEDSALYQAVYRLEERGLLQAEWGVTENNRRARYYKITAAGRAHLRAETKNWVEYADTVTTILTAKSIPCFAAASGVGFISRCVGATSGSGRSKMRSSCT